MFHSVAGISQLAEISFFVMMNKLFVKGKEKFG